MTDEIKQQEMDSTWNAIKLGAIIIGGIYLLAYISKSLKK
jgi:hypothetical protein